MKSRRANPVKIGIFVIGGLVILTVGVLYIGSGRLFRRTHAFVSYFDGSVNGLRAGAAVKFKGVEVGMVDRIRIPGGLLRTDQPIAVFYALDGDKLEEVGGSSGAWAEIVSGAIHNGLRAQLESDSMVTGVQHVSLVFTPEAAIHPHEAVDGAMEIPTVPPPLQEVGAALRSIVDRIGRYDFEALLDSLKGTLDGVAELSRSAELRAAIVSVDTTLKDVDAAVLKIEAHVDPLAGQWLAVAGELTATLRPLTESLRQASDKLQALALALEATLASTRMLLDPRAPIAVELRAGLKELSEMARSTRALFEMLERDPGSLLRGKGAQEEKPR
jgi:paraquat-inducible protein B